MNKDIKAIVDTPHGKTDTFSISEAVRQGTIFGPPLCGVSTNRINKMTKRVPVVKLGKDVEIGYPVYVDDMAGMGSKEMILEMGDKMKGLESTKKYQFNNKRSKTEILAIINDKKKGKEEIEVEVRSGKIGETEEYKYLGDCYDKTGNNEIKISKKMEKSMFMVNEVKWIGCFNTVGSADMVVRMFLLETTINPTLLSNMETWCSISKKEEDMITKAHYKVLRKIFDQPEGTPYYGIVSETGIWPYTSQITFKKLMFAHRVINSDPDRVVRRIMEEQSVTEGNNWWNQLKEKAEEI